MLSEIRCALVEFGAFAPFGACAITFLRSCCPARDQPVGLRAPVAGFWYFCTPIWSTALARNELNHELNHDNEIT